ncbi:MAG: hypothetical protein JST84_04570 [Acidobacteria bacterium]|nr:hypothetical protein [Acidobacteriota bacterium]
MFSRKLTIAFSIVLLLVTGAIAFSRRDFQFPHLRANLWLDDHPSASHSVPLATPTLGAHLSFQNNQSKTSSSPWYIYKDGDFTGNHGEWTNGMPKEVGQMLRLSLVDKTDPYSGSTAIRVDVDFRPPMWCGIAVASAPDYWGETPGPGYDLSRAKKLVFYAKGDKGGESIQIKTAITGDKKFGDSARTPAATPWITLKKEWTRYELPLEYKRSELKRVITPFVFVTSRDHNTAPTITFYLDEIYIELDANQISAAPVPGSADFPFFSYLKSKKPEPALVAFTPTNYDPRPGTLHKLPTTESLRADLIALQPVFDGLVLYGYDKGLTPRLLSEAKQLGYRAVMLGIWDPSSEEEIADTAALAKQYDQALALAICIGNEGINFNRYSLNDLSAAAIKLRRLLGPRVPFCTSEPFGQYGQKAMLEFGQFLAPNIHPVFDQADLDPAKAANWARERAQSLAETAGKPLLVKETGFPHGGDIRYTSMLQERFWATYVRAGRFVQSRRGANCWVSYATAFEAYDLPWKAEQSNNPIEKAWGFLDQERRAYPVFNVWKNLRRR